MLRTKTVSEFLDELASSSPAPGGGSVAALSGVLGTALTSMVCRLTIGKKKYADVQTEMEATLRRSEALRASLSELIEKDAEAFNAVMQAFSLPKESEEEQHTRSVAIQAATKNASLVPLKVMELCAEVLPLTKTVAERGNVNSISDAGVAALMLQSACSAAALNVWINLGTLKDESFVQQTRGKVEAIQTQAKKQSDEILALVSSKL